MFLDNIFQAHQKSAMQFNFTMYDTVSFILEEDSFPVR